MSKANRPYMRQEETERDTLKKIAEAVLYGRHIEAKELAEEALKRGVHPVTVIDKGFVAGINEVGERYRSGEYFVTDMLMSARAMKEGLSVILPKIRENREAVAKIVIGTVEGDVHDIGKNIVSAFLQAAGFEVIDLGVDVPCEKFVDAVRNLKPDILAMSALLTSTMGAMDKCIKALQEQGLREHVRVLVGGAPITDLYAKKIGADGFGEDAVEAVQIAREMITAKTEK